MKSMTALIAGVALAFSPFTADAGDALERIRETRTLRIAHREASIPFSYLAAPNLPVGYSIDICKQLAAMLERELKIAKLAIEFVQVTSATRFTTVAEGRADLECGSSTNNAERRKLVDFSTPHFIASSRMVTGTMSGIRDWRDLHSRRLVTTKGSTNARMIHEMRSSMAIPMTIIEATDHQAAFQMVEAGTADAFAMDDVLLYGLKANSKAREKLHIVGRPLSVEPYAIAFVKNDPDLKRMIDIEMRRMVETQALANLHHKWFEQPIPPNGITLGMPISRMLRNSWAFPTTNVAD
jgi:ABC-type amino acid transport substrate-binding protein